MDRAHQAGMISVSDEEIAAHAELALSVVPPGEALALAERLQPVFERQSRRPSFMDCNAVNPSTLDRIRAAVGQDEHFLDTCTIGSPPKPGGPSPTLYVCGPSSAQATSPRDLGLEVRLLPRPVGRASGLKTRYGGITKGLVACVSAWARTPIGGQPVSQDIDFAAFSLGLRGQLSSPIHRQLCSPRACPSSRM